MTVQAVRTVARTQIHLLTYLLTYFQSNADRPRTDTHYCSCDLDLDPMTLTYEADVDILKMYLHTRSELARSRLSKFRGTQTNRQTDTQTDSTETITTLHSPVVVKPGDFHATSTGIQLQLQQYFELDVLRRTIICDNPETVRDNDVTCY